MTVNRTTLLDLPLPVTGTESGTWGDTTNNGLTQYLDIAIAGTLVLSTDADVTLTSTEGDSSATNIGATTAQYAILRWTATGSTTRNITALAQSKTYVVINATGGTQSIVLRGAGPTTGVTIISGEKALCVWNGSDFVKVSSSAAAGGSNTQVQYNSSGVLAGSSNMTFDGTSLTLGGNPTLSAGTANGVLYLNGSKVATSGSALTFDGTNLGVGTASPSFKLQVVGNQRIQKDNAGYEAAMLSFSTPTETGAIYRMGMATGGAFAIGRSDASTTNLTLDSSGNLGLGVTPSAWNASWKALQVGGSAALWGITSGAGSTFLSSNTFFDGAYKYLNTGAATYYAQSSGSHTWNTAPSGTAGNAITFTQALTLNASGDLFLGATSAAFAEKFRMSGNYAVLENGSYTGFIGSGSSLGTGTASDFAIRSSNAIAFLTGGATERARITSGGDLLVGDTAVVNNELLLLKKNTGGAYVERIWNPATSGDNGFIVFVTEATNTERGSIIYNRAGGLVSYNTTSDYRAKDIIGPVQNPGATIDALKVYEGVMKGATQSRPMLIAHEAQAHAPYAVTGEKDAFNEDGTPKFQQIDVSSLVPLLLAEIQSLRQRVALLEGN